MGRNRTSELKVMANWIFLGIPFWILSVLIYYGPESDILAKSYERLNLLGAFLFNVKCVDILWAAIGHPSQKLFSREFRVQFQAS